MVETKTDPHIQVRKRKFGKRILQVASLLSLTSLFACQFEILRKLESAVESSDDCLSLKNISLSSSPSLFVAGVLNAVVVTLKNSSGQTLTSFQGDLILSSTNDPLALLKLAMCLSWLSFHCTVACTPKDGMYCERV
jgi:hypothetical protein